MCEGCKVTGQIFLPQRACMNSTKCDLCNLIENPVRITGGIVHQSEYFYVIHHQPPVDIKGWLIIVPGRHIESQTELTREELDELIHLQAKFTSHLKGLLLPERIYWVCFSEVVRHIHFHLIPRAENLPVERRGPKIFSRDEAKLLKKQEIKDFCKELTRSR
jgi:diadenosine tetraphosphate (Ap4A) HIT family hydrolase